ncbi:MAG: hypothetical protein ACJ768_14130 [Gaiellaceae bacterium]
MSVKRIAYIPLLLAVLAGCGGSDQPATNALNPQRSGLPPAARTSQGNDAAHIRALVTGFLHADAAGEGRTACSYLTATAERQARSEMGAARLAPASACVKLFSRPAGNRLARGASVRDVAFKRGVAYATVLYPRSGRSLHSFVLAQSGGGWRIASLPGSDG